MLQKARAAGRAMLSPAEMTRFGAMALVVVALNALGWGIFAFAIQPHHFRYAGLGIGLGVALTAWTLWTAAIAYWKLARLDHRWALAADLPPKRGLVAPSDVTQP